MYPWAYDAWLQQQRIHWIPEEVSLADDVNDWKTKLSGTEKNLLTQIFRFFTQADIEVNNCYMRHYTNIFKPTEICMMLASFSNMETIHIAAYSYLLDTIGMPESEYQAFLKYDATRKKYEYMLEFEESKKHDKKHVAKTLAVFGAFTEGLQLFASFAILLNFQRFGKMKGMGQIIAWSARDETLHTNSIINLFNTFIKENNEIWNEEFKEELYSACRTIVRLEDEFIKLAFDLGDVEGLSAEEVRSYIRYIANRRLIQLDLKPMYNINNNPLPWLDEILNGVEHTNFFENRVTEYSRAATQGTWEEAFS